MSNRAPTPLELGCADPKNPCIIDNFLSSDPALKQVVGQTFEAGFRGENAFGQSGKLQWSAGLFRTTLANDILPAQSPYSGFGYYTNVGTTLRRAPSSARSGMATGGPPTPTTPISTPSISRPSWSHRRSIPLRMRTG